jgi:hypothetical protein
MTSKNLVILVVAVGTLLFIGIAVLVTALLVGEETESTNVNREHPAIQGEKAPLPQVLEFQTWESVAVQFVASATNDGFSTVGQATPLRGAGGYTQQLVEAEGTGGLHMQLTYTKSFDEGRIEETKVFLCQEPYVGLNGKGDKKVYYCPLKAHKRAMNGQVRDLPPTTDAAPAVNI